MKEETIRSAALDALNDLQLESEIKNIFASGDKGEWCVQFAGNYGQLCDKFQDQFDKENSPELIREKIKRYLLKQVTKIRSTSGKTRRGRGALMADKKRDEEFSLGTPLKMIENMFDRVTQVAGGVINVASNVTETASDAVEGITSNTRPVVVEVETTTTRRTPRKPARPSAKKKAGATSRKPSKASKAASSKSGASKKASNVSKAGKKTAGKAKGSKGAKRGKG